MARGRGVKREERIEWIRKCALEKGWPRWKVYRAIRTQFGVSDRTIRRDLEELTKRYQATFDSTEWSELQIAGSVERLRKIAIDAAAKDKFRDAIAAEKTLLQVHGARSDRWAALAPKGGATPTTQVAVIQQNTVAVQLGRDAAELSEMSIEDLERLRDQGLARFLARSASKRGEVAEVIDVEEG